MSEGFILQNRVKELRSRLGLRQADLAREVDVTRQTIIAIEKGKLNPSIVICLKIARILREPVDYVFYLDRAGAAQGNDGKVNLSTKPAASKAEAPKAEAPKTEAPVSPQVQEAVEEIDHATTPAEPDYPINPAAAEEPISSVAAINGNGYDSYEDDEEELEEAVETAPYEEVEEEPVMTPAAEVEYTDAAEEPSFNEDAPDEPAEPEPAEDEPSGGQVMWNF